MAVACDIHAERHLAKAGGSKRKLRGIPTLAMERSGMERAKRERRSAQAQRGRLGTLLAGARGGAPLRGFGCCFEGRRCGQERGCYETRKSPKFGAFRGYRGRRQRSFTSARLARTHLGARQLPASKEHPSRSIQTLYYSEAWPLVTRGIVIDPQQCKVSSDKACSFAQWSELAATSRTAQTQTKR